MLNYLRIKAGKNRKSKNIIFKSKPNKFSKAAQTTEKYISKQKNILIIGAHSAGKTRELMKVWESREQIYKNQKFCLIKAITPLSEWTDFKGLLQFKILHIIEQCTNAIVFIDDIDQATGRKKEVIKDIFAVAQIVITTAKDPKQIDKTIELKLSDAQHIQLTSNADYDATYILFVTILGALLVTGQFELAIAVMAGRYALRGIQK